MVFCYSDLWPDNFLIADTGRATVIDFSEASILPSCFSKYVLRDNRLGIDISKLVWIPATEGVDNTEAVAAVAGRINIASAFLYKLGRRQPGGDQETQERIAKVSKGRSRYVWASASTG